MNYIWHTFFFDPVYNALVFFIDVLPGGDVGLAIIATVIVVKFILFPLSIKAVKTQKIMREIEPKLREIKTTYKDNREEQAKAMLAVYKEAGMNPFASILVMFLQIPFIIALYLAVATGGGVSLPDINVEILYSFIPSPDVVTMIMFGFFDITTKNLPLALAAGLTQFVYTRYAMPPLAPREANTTPTFKDDFARNMQLQMRYVMPLFVVGIAYFFTAAIALYFIVSNLMTLLQEYIVKRHR